MGADSTLAPLRPQRLDPAPDWATQTPGCRGPPRPNRRPPSSSLALLGDSGFPAATGSRTAAQTLLPEVQKCTFCRAFALLPSYVAPQRTALPALPAATRVSLHIQVKKASPHAETPSARDAALAGLPPNRAQPTPERPRATPRPSPRQAAAPSTRTAQRTSETTRHTRPDECGGARRGGAL
jgi:hypothetical protein